MGDALVSEGPPPPYRLARPRRRTSPVVVSSPHSGDYYPPEFVDASPLSAKMIRRSEDCHVHRLAGLAPEIGAPLLCATYPRAYIDLNRDPYELDPEMFCDPTPAYVNAASPRVRAGLGAVAKVVARGVRIYADKIPFAEAERRIRVIHRPYHAVLAALITETRERFGYCILLDCHSMPSSAAPVGFVLGDRHGASCHRLVSAAAQDALSAPPWRAVRNAPYAGGYVTRRYGRPSKGVHALQIEINRGLYMDEATYAPISGFAQIRRLLTAAMAAVGAVGGMALKPR